MSTASVSACDKIDFAEINVKDMPLLGQVMICIQGEIYPKIRNYAFADSLNIFVRHKPIRLQNQYYQ